MNVPPCIALSLLIVASSCGGAEESSDEGVDTGRANSFASELFVAAPPDDALDVRAAVDAAEVGQRLVVRGVVGGRKKAFVDERAMFVVIDPALTHCPDEEGCPTPWDYCCETQDTLLANTMTVQVVGADGAPVAAGMKGVHGLREFAQVVVVGTVRSAEGSVVLDAERIHVAAGD